MLLVAYKNVIRIFTYLLELGKVKHNFKVEATYYVHLFILCAPCPDLLSPLLRCWRAALSTRTERPPLRERVAVRWTDGTPVLGPAPASARRTGPPSAPSPSPGQTPPSSPSAAGWSPTSHLFSLTVIGFVFTTLSIPILTQIYGCITYYTRKNCEIFGQKRAQLEPVFISYTPTFSASYILY